MPFINVKTNQSPDKKTMEKIKSEFGLAITAIPGKSEGWLMVEIEPDCNLWFKGEEKPCAMVEVKMFGAASDNALTTLTSNITGTLCNNLGISSDRIYVAYFSTNQWGWNGSNF